MAKQDESAFGHAIKEAIDSARTTQAALARQLEVDAGQVSRWVNGKALPQPTRVFELEKILGADFSAALSKSTPFSELYVSAPISSLSGSAVRRHHDDVAQVVASLGQHVHSVYWPGEGVSTLDDLDAADLATEKNMRALSGCAAFLYVQFENLSAPSGALIEMGMALGRRMKTTVIVRRDVRKPFMLEGFAGVASSLSFLPKARIYEVDGVDEACSLVERNGRELLGLA